jgi:hypothetical protein
MSCCNYSPCTCGTETPCADPGLETTAKHLYVLDSQFCPRRLENQNGFLYYGSNGLRFSDSPRVPLAEKEISEGDTFGSLVINSGSNGIFQRIVPAAGVDGFLKADGAGNLVFADPTEASIPDPLTRDEINVTTLNVETLDVSGIPTLTGLQEDVVVSPIGLNGSNQLVKGQQQTISVAMFYETADPASSATPNYTFPSSQNAVVKCAVKIFDPDSIASTSGESTIVISKAGDYIIEWYGNFTGYMPGSATTGGNPFNPELWLNLNNTTISRGTGPAFQDRRIGGIAGGKLTRAGLNVGDQINIRGVNMRNPSGSENGTGLRGVTVFLTKIR